MSEKGEFQANEEQYKMPPALKQKNKVCTESDIQQQLVIKQMARKNQVNVQIYR